MKDKIRDRLISLMEIKGDISREDREVYEYALNGIWILGINMITSILIGVGLGVPWYSVLFLLAVIPLRSDAGGYHASDAWRCYFLSCGILVLVLMWVRTDFPFRTIITICMAVPSYIFIFRNAPLASENKPLDIDEQRAAGKRARAIMTAEMLIGFVCCLIDERAACTIMSAVICCGAGYIGWFLQKRDKQMGM